MVHYLSVMLNEIPNDCIQEFHTWTLGVYAVCVCLKLTIQSVTLETTQFLM